MPPEPYALSDKIIKAINRYAIRQFERTQSALTIKGFDELSVIQLTRELYASLGKKNKQQFEKLFVLRFLEVFLFYASTAQITKFAEGSDNKESAAKKTAKKQLPEILSSPDPITGYTYDNEVPRKQQRCEESINAVSGRDKKKFELKKALRFWTQQSQQYADIVSEAANVNALKEAGVKYVRWITMEDDRVCSDCEAMHGQVFPIDKIPDKPHWRCRCTVQPVSEPYRRRDNGASRKSG